LLRLSVGGACSDGDRGDGERYCEKGRSMDASSSDNFPVLVIAYDDAVRGVLVKNLAPLGTPVLACATFCEAENRALAEPCRGVLVDLTSIVKAKSEEKLVAYTLTRFYPTLRVRAMGPMIIPMMMAGDAKQDKNLNDFVSKTCAGTPPRKLRRHKRKNVCLPTCIEGVRGFTLDLSWGGAFIVDMNPERFAVGNRLLVNFADGELDVEVRVARVQHWGEKRPPGIGVEFTTQSQEVEKFLYSFLHSNPETDRDRLIG
jgi:hypothetical protein